jgi:hypothetical protein
MHEREDVHRRTDGVPDKHEYARRRLLELVRLLGASRPVGKRAVATRVGLVNRTLSA